MPLSESEELEMLELENEAALAAQPTGAKDPYGRSIAREESIRAEYPSEKFARYAEPISQFGGMLAKTPGIGTGLAGAATMGVEIAKQGIQAVGSEPGTPTTFTESGSRIAKAFGRGAAGEAVGRGVFKGAGMAWGAASPTVKTATSQVMRGLAGIPQRTAQEVLDNPEILSKALPVKEAGELFGKVIEQSGLKYGPEAVEQITGETISSGGAINKIINETFKKIKSLEGYNTIKGKRVYLEDMPENAEFVKQLAQEASAARYGLSQMLRAAKFGDPKLKASERVLSQKLETLDDWLEPRIPGFAEARHDYHLAKIKEEFNSLFPRNKNLSPDALRMMLAAGGATTALAAGAPGALVGVAAMSPKAWEYGIRGAAFAAPAVGQAAKFGTRLGTQAGANYLLPSSYSTDEIRRKYMERR